MLESPPIKFNIDTATSKHLTGTVSELRGFVNLTGQEVFL